MFACLRKIVMPALLLGWFTLAAAPAQAALVAEVRDDAGFFSAEAISKANEIIKEIHRDLKHDLLIETVKSVPASKADDLKKMDKEEFFSKWARDRARSAEVNGVYVLICKDPGHIQVEVGNETSKKAFTTTNRKELRDLMVEKFREAGKVKD
jgi:uncharacterized protein